jgi:hypothetical protein
MSLQQIATSIEPHTLLPYVTAQMDNQGNGTFYIDSTQGTSYTFAPGGDCKYQSSFANCTNMPPIRATQYANSTISGGTQTNYTNLGGYFQVQAETGTVAVNLETPT